MRKLVLSCLLLVLCAGCADDAVRAVRRGAAGADDFGAEIVLCRRVGAKTGKRLDVGDTFAMSDDRDSRYIYGFVDLRNVPPGRERQVHLVWIRPDGNELFRRFCTVRVEPDSAGCSTQVTWLDAEDLHDATSEEPVLSERPDVTLGSRLNVDPDKNRTPGTYALRVYWERELLAEKTFELTAGGD
jgi:hypothetical protein